MSLPLRVLLLILVNLSSIQSACLRAQSLRKLERRAINRSHLTFVNGDTVQRFTLTDARPHPRPGRYYYWQGSGQILHAAGAYDGRLLTDNYRLTTREGHLLVRGSFYNGLKTGLWQTWRANGALLSQSRWQAGQLRGPVRHYDETGRRIKAAREAAADPPAAPRFWQPKYWQRAWQTRQQRRAARRTAISAPPVASPAAPIDPANTPTTTPLAPKQAASESKTKKLKVKKPASSTPEATPGLAPSRP